MFHVAYAAVPTPELRGDQAVINELLIGWTPSQSFEENFKEIRAVEGQWKRQATEPTAALPKFLWYAYYSDLGISLLRTAENSINGTGSEADDFALLGVGAALAHSTIMMSGPGEPPMIGYVRTMLERSRHPRVRAAAAAALTNIISDNKGHPVATLKAAFARETDPATKQILRTLILERNPHAFDQSWLSSLCGRVFRGS